MKDIACGLLSWDRTGRAGIIIIIIIIIATIIRLTAAVSQRHFNP
jgi:hypothetical protein